MVNGATPAASKLLEQIKRLSTQTTKKETIGLDFKNDVMNNRTNDIKNVSKSIHSQTVEKIQKKVKFLHRQSKTLQWETQRRTFKRRELPIL